MSGYARFQVCLPRILKHEGGWADDPQDPGGATMKGVTIGTFRTFKGRPVTKDELRNISDSDLSAIYHTGYWLASGAERCPVGLDYIVFDCAVNQGTGRAVRWLQQAVGATPDGMIGPKTLSAIRAAAPLEAIESFSRLREAHYRGLRTFPRFGRGWMRRLNETTAQAKKDAGA